LNIDNVAANVPFGALMDLNISGAHASVVAFCNGEASIYLSSGGGFIGGGQHASVASAAEAFVAASLAMLPRMKAVTKYPLPSAGMTNFYALTSEAVLFAEDWDEEFTSRKSPFLALYSAAQNLIRAYRMLPAPPSP
jgi:hypothetical protein